jgi:Uma2 family endonuclease
MVTTPVSLEHYLKTPYHPDVDYADGYLEERNAGEREHGELQLRIAILLKRTPRKVFPYIETRLRVSRNRYRVPDVCVYENKSEESVFTRPPLLCVEILSPEDRINRMREGVIEDYLRMGVPDVWVLDPIKKIAFVPHVTGFRAVNTEEIATSDRRVVLTLADVFSDQDL